MIDIKILKKIKDGLITYQKPKEDEKIKEPLYIDANYKYTENSIELYNGIIYFYIEDYKKLVFEIVDNFTPKNPYDIGGVSVIEGSRIYNLYHYENNTENIKYNNIRVSKIMNKYYGFGSADGQYWIEKGDRFLNNAELIGVTYESIINSFPLKEIKIYKDPSWYIQGLYEGFLLKIYNEDETKLIHNILVDRTNIVKITDDSYPSKRKVKIWDNENNLITDSLVYDIWGGDEYYLSLDIELYNSKKILLNLEEAKHLGVARVSKPLRELIYIVNKTETDSPVTVRILPESPAYNWVELEYLENRGKEIFIPLKGSSEETFYIVISQPGEENNNPPDYKPGEEYLFYLEIF